MTRHPQAMVSSNLDLKTGKFRKTEPKRCECCMAPEVYVDHDSARSRIMTCDACGAIEIITKGKPPAIQWWYHGARQPQDWPAAFLVSVRE